MAPPRAAVIGLSGPTLTADEVRLLRATPPLGVMLFRRNIEAPEQLAGLAGAVRAALPAEALLFVDQEGGRVARLRPPHWSAHPPAARIGALFERDPAGGRRAAFLTGALIGLECRSAGFDVVCAPVLDRLVAGASEVVGDRAFGASPDQIVALAGGLADGLLAAGVHPVGKHAPGHGRASVDSHVGLPELDRPEPADLAPFAALAWLPWMMTAHILFTDLDPSRPATLSRTVLQEVVRGRLGFGNLLISDDLAMGALEGDAGGRARACLAAGCDVALHCSGELADSAAVLDAAAPMGDAAMARLASAEALVRSRRRELDGPAMHAEREALLC